MRLFAKVRDGIVVDIIVAEPEFFLDFKDTSPGDWIETCKYTRGGVYYDPETGEPAADQTKALRKNYAGIGFTYDEIRDAFIPESPFPSWVLNETTCLWDPPIPEPNDGIPHRWNEELQTWQTKEEVGEE